MSAPESPPAAASDLNGYAIASLVLGVAGLLGLFLVGPVLALVFGYSARRDIDASGGRQGGRGLAVAGIVLGWVGVALTFLFLAVILVVAFGFGAGTVGEGPSP